MPRRFAIYWAPEPESALGRFGQSWLGRDIWSGDPIKQPRLPGLTDRQIVEWTAEPRRYGFHATLKAPFALAPGTGPEALHEALQAFARLRTRIEIPGLRLAVLGRFAALVPVETPPALNDLADGCVRTFDRFRAPPTTEEIDRRRAGLTARQDKLFERWGYPYVFEEFRFHLTLSGRLPEENRKTLLDALSPAVAGFEHDTIPITAVILFEQPSDGAPFRAIRKYAFGGA